MIERLRASPRVALALPVLYAATLWTLSSMSRLPSTSSFPLKDKGVHAVAFGILAVLSTRAFSIGKPARSWLLAAVVGAAVASAYGGIDEFHQSFVPGRSSDVMDWAADTIGAVIGAALYAVSASRSRATG